jgi:hypothetical protein
MLASYWNDPAPGGLVEMAKSVVQGVRAPGRVLSGAYTVTPEVPGQWSEVDEFRAQHAAADAS